MYPLQVAGALLFAVALGGIATVLGYRALRLIRVPTAAFEPVELGFLSLTFGTALLQYLPHVLGLGGWLTPPFVKAAMAVLLIVALPDLWRGLGWLRARARELPLKRPSAPVLAWGASLVALLSLMLIRGLVVGHMSEDDGYHLTAPKRWLASGALIYLPSYTNTNAALGFEMLYLIAIACAGLVAAKVVSFGSGVLALLGIVLVARRISNVKAGLLAISLLLITTPICAMPALFSLAFVDLATTWLAMASVLVWLVWRERREPNLLWCLALCTGFTGSFKVTSISISIALAIVAFGMDSLPTKSTWVAWVKRFTAFGLLSSVPVLPWFARNWVNTGNPLFPMLSGLISTRDWTPEHAALFARYTRYYAWGVGSGSRLDENTRGLLLLATGGAIVVSAIVALLLVKQPVLRRLIVVAVLLLLPCVASTGLVFRYWMPALVILCIVGSALWVQRSPLRAHTMWFAAAALTLALALRLRPPQTPTDPRLGRDLKILAGLSTLEEEYPEETMYRLSLHINRETPPDSHVLYAAQYVSFGASSFCDVSVDRICYATDSHLQRAIRLEDWPTFLDSIRRAGIDYVVISERPFAAGRHGFSFPAGENEYPFCRRLVDEHGEMQLQLGSIQLYRLRLDGGAPAS